MLAGKAQRAVQRAVHVHHPLAAGSFMKISDVLRHQNDVARKVGFKPRQRCMTLVWFGVRRLRAARIVKIDHELGIPGKALWRRHIFNAVLRP